jgi:hypothetical protein
VEAVLIKDIDQLKFDMVDFYYVNTLRLVSFLRNFALNYTGLLQKSFLSSRYALRQAGRRLLLFSGINLSRNIRLQ